MKFLGLVLVGLRRKPIRTLLVLASVVVAFLLFGILQSVSRSFSEGITLSGADRLVTAPRYSIIDDIPVSYGQRILQVPGVKQVTHLSWFGGVYKEQRFFFPRWPVGVETFFEVYPEYILPDEQRAAFIEIRTAAIVGRRIAEEYGMQVGDKIPLRPNIWPNQDNSTWEFDLVGIYDGSDDTVNLGQMFMQYDFFDEYRQFGKGGVGQFVLVIEDPQQSATIAAQIDALFANSTDETKTQTEKAYNQMFANQSGNIVLIMTGILLAVFFTLLLLTGNTLSQAVRERIPELAILKTLGFSNLVLLLLVLAESVLLLLTGAAVGLALAALMVAGMPPDTPFLGGTQLPLIVVAQGLGLALLLSLLVGALPALRAMRLNIVTALRAHA